MYFDEKFITKLFRFGVWIILILSLLDILTYFFYPKTVFGEVFLVTREQTPLTWLSSIVLFIVGITCASAYFKTRKSVWYFLSLTYLFFSMDDASYFHERVTGALQNKISFLSSFPSYSWVLVYFPLLVFGLGGLIYMLWRDSSRRTQKLFVVSVMILALAIFLDLLDGFIAKDSTLVFCISIKCHESITHMLRLTEEVIEVIGFGLLAYLNIKEHSLVK